MGKLVFFLKRDDWAGFAFRLVVLSTTLIFSLGLALLVSFWGNAQATCLNAFLFVLPCSLAGLMAGEFPRGPNFAILRLTGSILGRSGLLLFFLLIARRWDLLNGAFIYYILAFYAIGLFADVSLSSLKSWQGELPDNSSQRQTSELAAN